MLLKGNLMEIHFALELLVQLSFDDSIREDLNEENELKKFLAKDIISKHRMSFDQEDKNLFHSIEVLIEQLKWNINNKKDLDDQKYNEIPTFDHIMISCDERTSVGTVLKIKEKLESGAHRPNVWIASNETSSLEARISAIERSSCVIVCITEKYRQSITCQIEARHALKTNKKIIPLIMQRVYENAKGWIGQVILKEKSKCIHFSKEFESFENSMLKLERELNLKSSISNEKINEVSPKTSNRSSTVEDWSESQAQEWFAKNNLNNALFEYFKPLDGKILKQMNQMKKVSSDFFFKSLSEIEGIKFYDIVLFSACLDDLFKNK